MSALTGRLRAAIIAITAATLAAATLAPAAAAHPEPASLDAFMRALGQVESAGRYDAVNAVSGAYGKYQIMPANWPVWAKTYLGNAAAPQTPQNQESVARGRILSLWHGLGSWPRVAYWWLTGLKKPVAEWSAYARRYVDKVMALVGGQGWTMASAAPGPASAPRATTKTAAGAQKAPAPAVSRAPIHLDEGNPAIVYSGRWSTAGHSGYAGGSVRWSTTSGASLAVTFTGRTIAWVGPVGPTRGSARVYVDGVLVTTISQHAGAFVAQRTLFTRDFGTSGTHTLRIVVAGTAGHSMVAVDQLVVGF